MIIILLGAVTDLIIHFTNISFKLVIYLPNIIFYNKCTGIAI